jgi:hypothetical protein
MQQCICADLNGQDRCLRSSCLVNALLGAGGDSEGREQYPSTSLVVACYDNLLLLHGEWKCLEVWLFTLEDTSVEAVLVERV